jgi:hypothetical protein
MRCPMRCSLQVLSILQPKSNLHILAEDDDVFWDLPLSVQRQVRLGAEQQPLTDSQTVRLSITHNKSVKLQRKHRAEFRSLHQYD